MSYRKTYIIENGKRDPRMQKNSGPIISVVEVDPIDGSYVIKLPESVVNDLGWYDGTEVVISIDGNEIIVTDLETFESF